MWIACCVVFMLLFSSTPRASASRGDKLGSFRICLSNCSNSCDLNRYPGVLPLYLRLFGWSCEDECKYQCMFTVTELRVKRHQPILQFYGKVGLYRDGTNCGMDLFPNEGFHFAMSLLSISNPKQKPRYRAKRKYKQTLGYSTWPLDTEKRLSKVFFI